MQNPPVYSVKKSILILIAVVIAIVLTVALFARWFHLNVRSERNLAQPQTRAQSVPQNSFIVPAAQWETLNIQVVQSAPFRAVLVTDGAIATNDNLTLNVFSPYSGRVSRVIARLGDPVKKGDPLMAVEATEFVQGQNDLIAAVNTFNTATTQFHLAEKTESRQHELFLAKAGAKKDWLQSQSDLTAAQNAMRTADIALSAVRNRLRILGKSDAEITALETTKNAQRLGAESVVKAPISGTVVQRQVGAGQYIQSASGGAANPLFSIADLSSVWLIANLRETDVAAVKVGQAVEVNVPAYPDRLFKATIAWVSPLVDAATHRVPIRAEISNRDHALKPLMLATFGIVTGESGNAIAIPQSAVIYEGSTARIFVARDEHIVQARTIQVGRQNGELVEAISGVAPGEKIVTSGALFIDRAFKSRSE